MGGMCNRSSLFDFVLLCCSLGSTALDVAVAVAVAVPSPSPSPGSPSRKRLGERKTEKAENPETNQKVRNPSKKGGTMCFGSRSSVTSGGAGEPFRPRRAPQPPPPPLKCL